MSENERIAASVAQHGWHAIGVDGTARAPPLLYTIGLCLTFGHPEIVLCGLQARAAHSIVRDMVAAVREGSHYLAGARYQGVLDGHEMAVRPVHRTQCIIRMGYAMGFYRHISKPDMFTLRGAVQAMWPDRSGHFPFEPACDLEVVRLQPALDREVPPDELRAFMKAFGQMSN